MKTYLTHFVFAMSFVVLVGRGAAVREADEIPGATQSQMIALINGVVHTVSGQTFEKGVVVFDKGKITHVSGEPGIPANATVIDLKGKHVYPGLIDAYTDMGLIEINAVRATRDQKETGSINPNARAEVAVNPDSELIPVARSNGVLVTLTAPNGGRVSGTSAWYQTWWRILPDSVRPTRRYLRSLSRRW